MLTITLAKTQPSETRRFSHSIRYGFVENDRMVRYFVERFAHKAEELRPIPFDSNKNWTGIPTEGDHVAKRDWLIAMGVLSAQPFSRTVLTWHGTPGTQYDVDSGLIDEPGPSENSGYFSVTREAV